jgi:hypothetical protein
MIFKEFFEACGKDESLAPIIFLFSLFIVLPVLFGFGYFLLRLAEIFMGK